MTGANGSGKSSLYRALRLLADASRNGAVAALAREGGLQSTLWAGPEGGPQRQRHAGHGAHQAVGLRLGFAGDDFGYALDLGMPVPAHTAFNLDPEFKREALWTGPVLKPAPCSPTGTTAPARPRRRRRLGATRARSGSPTACSSSPPARGARRSASASAPGASTTSSAPTRTRPPARARIGTRTPVLDHDGADLAAALQTIRETGDVAALDAAVDDAFPGARVEIVDHDGALRAALPPARPAAPARRGRALRRHAAVPALGRRAAHPAPAGAAGAQRAGDEPAPGSARRRSRR